MKRIGYLGAYSIANAGDQLLGYAVRQALKKRVPKAEHLLFAPAMRGEIWRHAWDTERGIDTTIQRIPADDSVRWMKGLDAVVIGGGGIIRLEPEFQPFVLGDPDRWPKNVRACWNSLGAEATPVYLTEHRDTYRRIARCCETLSYVSVRNAVTARFVRRCGYSGELHVVPDPAFLLSLPEDDFAERTLRAAGVDTDEFVVGVSVGNSVRDPRATHFYTELFGALARLVAKRAVTVVLFPFGEIYGDPELQRVALSSIPGAKIIDRRLGPLELWRLVGALDLYLCARYHAVIAAFAQDIPFLAMDEYLSDATASSKIRELVTESELEAHYLVPYVSRRPAAKLDNLLSVVGGDWSFGPRLAPMQQELERHYDRMVASLGL